MIGSLFFEKMLKKSGAQIVLDFDDAIWLPTVSEVNKSLQWLKHPEKVNDIIALSDLVIVGNNYLKSYAQKFNNKVVVFPSTIDLDYYKLPSSKKRANETVSIGWSGSHTTIEHFETIVPVLKKLKQKYGNKIRVVVYGDKYYRNNELGIEGVAWSHETEISIISSFDIGIMPLPDNDWTRGKCAMKGLQYMGLAVCAVLSPVGINKEIIRDGINGFIADTEDEWVSKLSMLIENRELREMTGAEGRKTVEQKFSSQVHKEEYKTIFQSLLNNKHKRAADR
jgi:glycosyltransferase involved in cell wall biosynthesis